MRTLLQAMVLLTSACHLVQAQNPLPPAAQRAIDRIIKGKNTETKAPVNNIWLSSNGLPTIPSETCSIPLTEMPIPEGQHFASRQAPEVRSQDRMPRTQGPAPPCPTR